MGGEEAPECVMEGEGGEGSVGRSAGEEGEAEGGGEALEGGEEAGPEVLVEKGEGVGGKPGEGRQVEGEAG